MKVSDLVNVLHHLPSDMEVDDVTLQFTAGSLKASQCLANILAGKTIEEGAKPIAATPTT